ncbi:hypothetical protein IG631_10202 [Alternaria alternata]|nr:hypothetical protein IG631_10202 [Alternaria alternata]
MSLRHGTRSTAHGRIRFHPCSNHANGDSLDFGTQSRPSHLTVGTCPAHVIASGAKPTVRIHLIPLLATKPHECEATVVDTLKDIEFYRDGHSRAFASILISITSSLKRSDRRRATNHHRPRQETAEPLSGYRRSK